MKLQTNYSIIYLFLQSNVSMGTGFYKMALLNFGESLFEALLKKTYFLRLYLMIVDHFCLRSILLVFRFLLKNKNRLANWIKMILSLKANFLRSVLCTKDLSLQVQKCPITKTTITLKKIMLLGNQLCHSLTDSVRVFAD